MRARVTTVGVVLAATGAVGVALLAASLVPSATLAARLLGVVGEARGGAYTQELFAFLDERLRISGLLLLALAAGLIATRPALEDLLCDLAWPRCLVSLATLFSVGAATLAAIVVRIPFLSQPMRYDEALTFNEFSSRPLYYGLSFYPDPNNHLLNTLLMHAAYVAFGNEPWVLRLPALLGGVLLVPATYALARELFGAGAAVFSATLVAASSFLVEYSTNGRGYALQALAVVVVLWLVIVAARRSRPAALLGAAVVGALGAYAVPTMVYGVVIAAVQAVRLRKFRWRQLLASGLVLALVVGLLYLPVLIVSGPDKLAANRFVVPLSLQELASELPRTLAQTWAFWNRDIPWPLAALLVVGFAIGTRREPLGVLALGICLVAVLVQRVAPFERVWLFLLPLYFVIAAGGLARFVDGRILAGVFGIVMGFVTLTSGSILNSTETGVFPDAEAVAQTLGPRLAPDDAVQTTLPTSLPELQYYFPKYGLPINVLVRAPDEAQNVWLISDRVADPGDEVARFSRSTLYKVSRAAPAAR